MEIERIQVGGLATNAYIVYSKESDECLVIDPGDEAERILNRVRELGLSVEAIVLTHGHFDHTGGAGRIQRETWAEVYIGAGDAGLLTDPGWMAPFAPPQEYPVERASVVEQGDTISCDGLTLEVLETPGHSQGSISLYTPGFLFSGDLLFKRAVGRTDLPGGDWETLHNSITRKVLSLPDDTRVLPGHGPETTIGEERHNNPFL